MGGGIAGLNALIQLKKVGLIANVYEGKERLGGRVHSIKIGAKKDTILDLGGSFINSDHEDLLTLAQELGVDVLTLSPLTAWGCSGRFLIQRAMLSNTSTSESYSLSTGLKFRLSGGIY
ncbi:FAD-dependent oxidoreductase [Aphanothece sacrum]|uniref:FAD-dependent oxidoreductase n=1 Tax=Aphanothece sacrum TaxID=1122 RepID=UPI0034CDA0D5